MDLITSLIFLVVLIVPPLYLAGRKVLRRLSSDETAAPLGKRARPQDSSDQLATEQRDNSQVYDGMITIEIPVADAQVIAYEPLSDTGLGLDDEIIVVEPVCRASRA